MYLIEDIKPLIPELLEKGVAIRVKVGGFSMFPFIRKGDTAIINRVDFKVLEKGDVVLFRKGNKYIAHRLLKHYGERILTKGDTAEKADEPVKSEDYLGIILQVIRKGKQINLYSNQNKVYSRLMLVFTYFYGFVFNLLRKTIKH